MTANYSTREYREKLYDDLHVRLRDTAILMCAIFIASIGLNMNSTDRKSTRLNSSHNNRSRMPSSA